MLGGWHYIAVLAPIALLAVEWRRGRGFVIAVVFAGVLFAALEVAIDFRVRAIRAASPIPISSLSRLDPVRRRFGLLHGISSMALLAQVIIAAGATIAVERESRLE
jgi:hypothetical protein